MKKFGSLFLATAILAGITLVPAVSFAADGGEYDTNGVITFTPNNGTTDPVDPVDPTNPVKPVDPTDPSGPNQVRLAHCRLIMRQV